MVAIALACILAFYWLILSFSPKVDFLSNENMMKLVSHGMVAVAILIVAVPEGLPLAVSIASVFSYDRLMAENLLIKDSSSMEKCG